MDTGGLAQLKYTNNTFMPSNFNAQANGFASRGKNGNLKRLSMAVPPKADHFGANGSTSPLPRATSRSHLLAGLRTAPKSATLPSSQTYGQLPSPVSFQTGQPMQTMQGANGLARSATYANLGQNSYGLHAGQASYADREQILSPPDLYQQGQEADPAVLEQLQFTGMFLAQRQQQLQQQLASITAAANQMQGMSINGQYQQTLQAPTEVPGQPGLYLAYDSSTGQYQYVTAPQTQQRQGSMQQSMSMHHLSGASTAFEPGVPTFRAEISPPPIEHGSAGGSRTGTPLDRGLSPNTHVQPLPPPSANAFRRGHQKRMSSVSQSNFASTDGKSGTNGLSRHTSVGSVGGAGTFGPGGNRAGQHASREPRGPPAIEELVTLPTAFHEGSKNFATRRRRRALNNLVRAGSMRREASGSHAASPTSDGELSLHSQAEEPGLYRKQSPIGSEMSSKHGSRTSPDLLARSKSRQGDEAAFDMGHFAKQSSTPSRQASGSRSPMLSLVASAEKRRTSNN